MVIFSIFLNIKEQVCCVYSLESSHRGDSYEYTQHTFSRKNNRSQIISILLLYLQSWKKFLGTHERVRNSRDKRAIGVRAMALQLQLFICVYNVLVVGNMCKLMLTPAILTSLYVISPVGFYLNVK